MTELVLGKDPVTGEEIPRLQSAVGLVAGLVPGGKALLKGGIEAAEQIAKNGDEVLQVSAKAVEEVVDSTRVVSNTTFYKVESGGVRGELPLSTEQRTQIESYLSNFNLKDVDIRWVDDRNLNTAYGDMFGQQILNIGSDVVPGNVGLGTLTANSRVSVKGTLAHEIVGHREAAIAGRTQDLLYLEEAQASIRAARFAPDLTSTERFTLLRDAITRLQNAPDGPVKARDVKDSLYIQNR